jgi:hypothetical protein
MTSRHWAWPRAALLLLLLWLDKQADAARNMRSFEEPEWETEGPATSTVSARHMLAAVDFSKRAAYWRGVLDPRYGLAFFSKSIVMNKCEGPKKCSLMPGQSWPYMEVSALVPYMYVCAMFGGEKGGGGGWKRGTH